MKSALFFCCLTFIFYFHNGPTYSQVKTTEFSFQFENKKYNGQIDLPESKKAKSIIVIIPGSGKTDFVAGNWYYELRSFFVGLGFGVCTWDKAGCGKSEGTFDDQQPVQNSAKEGLAAIAELKKQKISGSNKIGLWGISRGGWICPLMIEQDPSIAFWISASGVSALDNYYYLLETNLRIQGRTEEELKVLMSEFDYCSQQMRGDKPYDEVIASTKNLFNDPFCKSLGMGLSSEKELDEVRQYYKKSGFTYDETTGLQIFIPDFEQTLNKVECPVLAIFGEKDSQVDWRQTKLLYEKTIGRKANSKLSIRILPDCNHNIQKCRTCGLFEDLNEFNWRSCDGYYDAMKEWLVSYQLID